MSEMLDGEVLDDQEAVHNSGAVLNASYSPDFLDGCRVLQQQLGRGLTGREVAALMWAHMHTGANPVLLLDRLGGGS